MWTWVQQSGALIAASGEVIARGYAGKGEHKNKPESETVVAQGPIPRGLYAIRAPLTHKDLGPYALRLDPVASNQMHGRAGFWIHGDSVSRPGQASEGCPIVHRAARIRVWTSGDLRLRVVATDEDL